MSESPRTDPRKILEEIEAAGVFEDRMEYSLDDLMSAYEIDESQAVELQRLLHRDDQCYSPF